MIKKATTTADAVLAVINALVTDEDTILYAYPYKNGRENGWTLQSNTATVRFAENRNSDDIIVYVEPEISYADNCTEKGYQSGKLFGYKQYLEAAVYIITALLG